MPGKFGVSGTYKHYRETLVYRANWGDNRHNKVKVWSSFLFSFLKTLLSDRNTLKKCVKIASPLGNAGQYKTRRRNNRSSTRCATFSLSDLRMLTVQVVEEFPFLREVNYTDDWPVRVMSRRYIDARRKSIRRKAKGNDQGLRAEEIHRENRRSHSQHFQVKIEPGSPELST